MPEPLYRQRAVERPVNALLDWQPALITVAAVLASQLVGLDPGSVPFAVTPASAPAGRGRPRAGNVENPSPAPTIVQRASRPNTLTTEGVLR